jgi:hypothetical protein
MEASRFAFCKTISQAKGTAGRNTCTLPLVWFG